MNRLHTMMITADPGLAQHVSNAGVDLIFVDLETIGKAARQGHLDTWKSPHQPADISRVRAAAPAARIMVRLNPFHEGTSKEIEDTLSRGADALMLPMFRDAQTVARFHDAVGGRAQVVPLVETKGGLSAIPRILELGAADQIHIGLNDLALDLGNDFLFQPLADGRLESPAAALREAGMPFGIGGVARLGVGAVPAEVILGELARLGAEWVILSRAFHDRAKDAGDIAGRFDFKQELTRLQSCYADWSRAAPDAFAANREALQAAVAAASRA